MILMDLRIPNVNGIEAISRIKSEYPDGKVLMLSTYAGDVQVLPAIKAGARGYLLKGNVRKELLEVIRTVHAGRKRIQTEIAAEKADHAADDQLSCREIDVLRLIGAGNANKQIVESSRSEKQRSRTTSRTYSPSWAPMIGRMPLPLPYNAGSSS